MSYTPLSKEEIDYLEKYPAPHAVIEALPRLLEQARRANHLAHEADIMTSTLDKLFDMTNVELTVTVNGKRFHLDATKETKAAVASYLGVIDAPAQAE